MDQNRPMVKKNGTALNTKALHASQGCYIGMIENTGKTYPDTSGLDPCGRYIIDTESKILKIRKIEWD